MVPLYTQDRPDNVAYIMNNAGCKVLLFESEEQWRALEEVRTQLSGLWRLLAVKPLTLTHGARAPRIASAAPPDASQLDASGPERAARAAAGRA